MPAHTWVEHLHRAAAARGTSPALTLLGDGENETAKLTYAGLDERARSIAAHLQAAHIPPGDRVLLLYPSGLEFMAAFFGCLYAGVIAVPAFPPRMNRNFQRLQCIFDDARPTCVFTTTAMLSKKEAAAEMQGIPWVATETLSIESAAHWQPPALHAGSIAFLQYTSGSTSQPKGVIVTHANLLANHEMLRHAFAQDASSTIVVWLPLFHDMGLIGNVMQALYLGSHAVLMPPETFVTKPLRWLRAISRYRAHTSGGPNFGYDLCARKITAAQMEGLDLSSWKVAFNGAEPVRAETLKNFARTFSPAGFQETALYPCYGLAEATLFVAGGTPGRAPIIRGDGSHPVSQKVSCGRAWLDSEILIVDPHRLTQVPPGTTGEIWVRGPHVAAGYWNQPESSRLTFQARLAEKDSPPYLRTGDLGCMTQAGLWVEGRLKDLMIIAGENHHPGDVEQTVEASHPRLRSHASAAFSIEVDGTERLVVLAELGRPERTREKSVPSPALDNAGTLRNEILKCVRRGVSEQHGINVHDLMLLPPMGVPKTSSGKIQRHAARRLYLDQNQQSTPTA